MVHSLASVQDLTSRALIKRADDIAEVLMSQAPGDEANETLTLETVDTLYRAGMFGLKLPVVLDSGRLMIGS